MRNQLFISASLWLLSASNVVAATLLTDENLTRFEALLPKLQQLEQRPQNKQFALQQHCDWPRHYRELSAQEQDSGYQANIEQLVKQYGFTPVQFVELSAKISWPVLDKLQPMLQLSRQALVFLPPQQRQDTEKTLQRGQQYYRTLSGCLSKEDKTALAKHNNRIMQMAKRLGGIEQLLPPGMITPAT